MSTEELIDKIKSRGYWRVEIRPTVFEKLRIPTFSRVQEVVQSCKVRWRGWDYPHWNADTVRNMSDWVESSEDWTQYIEYWRFYRSGQFVHLFAAHEDHMDMERILPKTYPPRPPREGYISFLSTTYLVTEIFEFAARLANKDILRPSAFISIGLHNINGHELTSFSASRFLDEGFLYTTDEPILIEREIPEQQLVADPDNSALDFIAEIFERFNWNNPSRQILSEDQKRLRQRRL
jgi:hypothetical protein